LVVELAREAYEVQGLNFKCVNVKRLEDVYASYLSKQAAPDLRLEAEVSGNRKGVNANALWGKRRWGG
jgi:hypothetical protein